MTIHAMTSAQIAAIVAETERLVAASKAERAKTAAAYGIKE